MKNVYLITCDLGDPDLADLSWPKSPDRAVYLGATPENRAVWLWIVDASADISGLERMPFIHSVVKVAERADLEAIPY